MNNEEFMALLDKREPLDPELEAYLIEMEGTPFRAVKHPLVFAVPYIEQCNAQLNYRLRMLKAEAAEAKAKGEWSRYIWTHERPYRPDALQDAVAAGLGGPEYWELLGELWTDTEFPRQHGLARWMHLFGRMTPGKERLMREEDRAVYVKLPDAITVYRGSWKDCESGLSWTTDRQRAEWFARRLLKQGEKGVVTQGTAAKRDVIAYFGGRNESEVVINPRLVRDKSIVYRFTQGRKS